MGCVVWWIREIIHIHNEERLKNTLYKVKTLLTGIQLRNYEVLVIIKQWFLFLLLVDWCCEWHESLHFINSFFLLLFEKKKINLHKEINMRRRKIRTRVAKIRTNLPVGHLFILCRLYEALVNSKELCLKKFPRLSGWKQTDTHKKKRINDKFCTIIKSDENLTLESGINKHYTKQLVD